MNVPIPILSTKTTPKPIVHQSLIERYGLDTRLPSLKGKEKETDQDEVDEKDDHPGSTSKWEDTKEKREMDLKERKERMILEARK
jgi:coupling of ubiquitin conjugation to ER degradation protein 1